MENICSHISEKTKIINQNFVNPSFFNKKCQACEREKGKNERPFFSCISCGKVFCQNHMNDHFEKFHEHFLFGKFSNLSITCLQCGRIIPPKSDSRLEAAYSEMFYAKNKYYPVGYKCECFFGEELKEDTEELIDKLQKECFIHSTPLVESFDMVSKRCGMVYLQRTLEKVFGRKISGYDDHGVNNYTVERTIDDLKDDEILKFDDFEISGKELKDEAKSFRVYFLDKVVTKEDIRMHYIDKDEGRKWYNIFSKHFYISVSNISVIYDEKGLSLKKNEQEPLRQDIVLISPVGMDLSANRHTGVHFADFMYLLKRKDGKNIQDCFVPLPPPIKRRNKSNSKEEEKKKNKKNKSWSLFSFLSKGKTEEETIEEEKEEKEKEEDSRIDCRTLELWDDSYPYWISLDQRPQKKYEIERERFISCYKALFSLCFTVLQKEKVDIPIACAIGCGVFGRSFFPDYQECIIESYLSLLSEDSFGFKAIVLCEVNPKNLEVFRKHILKYQQKLKIPFFIIRSDMLGVARHINSVMHMKTSVMNAADLWEFGQFWEGGGALEEYLARQTTSYFSQHYRINPSNILDDEESYIGIKVEELKGLDEKEKEGMNTKLQHVKDYIDQIKSKYKVIFKDFVEN